MLAEEGVSQAEAGLGRSVLLIRPRSADRWLVPTGESVSQAEVGRCRLALPVDLQSVGLWQVLTEEGVSQAGVGLGRSVLPVHPQSVDRWLVPTGEGVSRVVVGHGLLVHGVWPAVQTAECVSLGLYRQFVFKKVVPVILNLRVHHDATDGPVPPAPGRKGRPQLDRVLIPRRRVALLLKKIVMIRDHHRL